MTSRVEALGVVLSARLAAQVASGSAVDLQLAVTLPTGIRMPVAHSALVSRSDRARVRTGSTLAVSLDPARPDTLRIDWAA